MNQRQPRQIHRAGLNQQVWRWDKVSEGRQAQRSTVVIVFIRVAWDCPPLNLMIDGFDKRVRNPVWREVQFASGV